MGRVNKAAAKERSRGISRRTLQDLKWLHLWGFLIAIISILVAITYGITFYSIPNERPFANSRSIYRTEKVNTKTLPSITTPFARNCAKSGVPVVLRNTVAKSWKAREKWTPSFLQSKLESLSGIYENDNRWFGPYYDRNKPLFQHSVRRNPYRTNIKMDAEEFFDLLHHPEEGKYHYYTGSIDDFGEWAYYEIQPLDELLLLNPQRSSVNVWVGQPHVIAHCHYDGYHNFYFQIYGRKKFFLFSPTNWPGLYPYPFLHPSHAQAQVNVSDPEDVEKFKLLSRVEALEVMLDPGDLLYIPPLWFHEVESQSVSVSVNVWTDSHQTEVMERVFSLPLPFNPDELSHRHEHTKWSDGRERRIGVAVFIHKLLDKICMYSSCLDAGSDKFFDASQSEKSSHDLYDKSVYFVYQLWSTRYADLMARGELADVMSNDEDMLCENNLSSGAEGLVLKVTAGIARDVHYIAYIEQVAQLVRGLPKSTWSLWVGNLVEYMIANAVDVEYIGTFLKELHSCTKYLK